MSAAASPSGALPYSLLLFDIEGTTTPISFVKEILFPFVTAHLRAHLQKNYKELQQTRDDVQAFRQLAEEDRASGNADAPLIPSVPADGDEAALAALFDAVAANVAWQMSTDRKTTALKQLQGHMWKVRQLTGASNVRLARIEPRSLTRPHLTLLAGRLYIGRAERPAVRRSFW